MGFWGLEVKPGKPQSYHPKDEEGKLHVTQATLGSGFGKEKSVVQCSVGEKTPIYLCSLLPNKNECCPLNLEFDDDDEPVEFSVTGDRSIHLSGFLESYDEDDDDSDGIDFGENETDESSDYDSEEDQMDEFEDFLDSNLEKYRNSSVPKSGVVIEEIEDEEKPTKDNKTARPKKKSHASEDQNAKKQIIATESTRCRPLESEDEDDDGLPIPKEKTPEPENKTGEKMDLDNDKQGSIKKRKDKDSEQDGVQERSESSKKNKKKKKNLNAEATVESKTIPSSSEKKISDSVPKGNTVNSKPSQVRTYPNGLIVEELAMGKPNAKRADPGKQVSVRYIGKLQKNGKLFDSNVGKAAFKFRLGVGQVIKGWDVGVNGMRVGDKRRLTIPPSMGYGEGGAGDQIPPNAWLTFEVELLDVK